MLEESDDLQQNGWVCKNALHENVRKYLEDVSAYWKINKKICCTIIALRQMVGGYLTLTVD